MISLILFWEPDDTYTNRLPLPLWKLRASLLRLLLRPKRLRQRGELTVDVLEEKPLLDSLRHFAAFKDALSVFHDHDGYTRSVLKSSLKFLFVAHGSEIINDVELPVIAGCVSPDIGIYLIHDCAKPTR